MADIITKTIPSSPSLGHIASLSKEKNKQGRGTFTKESPLKAKSPLLSAKSPASRKDHGKGNVLDIHV